MSTGSFVMSDMATFWKFPVAVACSASTLGVVIGDYTHNKHKARARARKSAESEGARAQIDRQADRYRKKEQDDKNLTEI
jgi:hypothetical protein